MDEIESIALSADVTGEVRAKLLSLIPEAFTEGKLDVVALQRALGQENVVEAGERFALTWAGKGDAYKVLQAPTSATLRPQRDLSVNFDTGLHTFIEGENLEVLKVLQKSYFAAVSFIYIDPPYNTGSDSFIYPDRFQEKREEYLKRINDLSDDGVLMRDGFFQKNTRESGRFHSNWLSMMLPRLYIARNLLKKEGVIFISCDDNELHTLRFLMDEILGEENFIAIICWKNVTDNNPTLVNKDNEFILCYGRTKAALPQAWKSHLSDSKQLLQTRYTELKDMGLTLPEIQVGIREFIADNLELMGNCLGLQTESLLECCQSGLALHFRDNALIGVQSWLSKCFLDRDGGCPLNRHEVFRHIGIVSVLGEIFSISTGFQERHFLTISLYSELV
ncbi:hypothetical protein HDF16_006027 [Granulicella aggregans]|uniref:DNA methylase N-4/N-6 domain-containing protein n=1 Tax=Granulicella aggregans TaxID=474949 RepID=A0A7W8E734_9BACT|nr:hypothetical protein [Granulicella aggregans]